MNGILRRPAVEKMVGLKRTAIYTRLRRGEFPKPVMLGSRAIGWRESDVAAWIASRPERGEG